MSDPKEVISFEEARRAYYIDFEGSKDGPPALLGWLYAEGRSASEDRLVLHHDILDEELACLAGHQQITANWTHRQASRSIGASLNDLVLRAVAQDRVIISWSQHELRSIAEAGIGGQYETLAEHFRDGKETAKRWLRICRNGTWLSRDDFGGTHKLVKYMELTGYPVPKTYTIGTTSQAIKKVRDALSAAGSYEALTSTQKSAWAAVLLHNAIDLQALRHIVMTAAAELEETE